MSDDTTLAPIEAHDSPLPDQLWSGLRTVAVAASTFALGRGWLTNDTAILLTAIGGVAWPIVAGQLKIRRRALELRQVARSNQVPASVARIKRP